MKFVNLMTYLYERGKSEEDGRVYLNLDNVTFFDVLKDSKGKDVDRFIELNMVDGDILIVEKNALFEHIRF